MPQIYASEVYSAGRSGAAVNPRVVQIEHGKLHSRQLQFGGGGVGRGRGRGVAPGYCPLQQSTHIMAQDQTEHLQATRSPTP